MHGEIGLLLMILLVIGGGWLLGVIAFFSRGRTRESVDRMESELSRLRASLEKLRDQQAQPQLWDAVHDLERRINALAPGAQPKPETPPVVEEQAQPAAPPEEVQPDRAAVLQRLAQTVSEEAALEPAAAAEALPEAETAPQPAAPAPPSAKPAAPQSLEFVMGSKWLLWAGAVMVIIGVAYFLKYAYDNNYIGPKGRLAIGSFWGIVAMYLGEHFRRRFAVLADGVTGIGLAIFYACVYFSFQVYHLSSAGVSFGFAIGVTALAITLAVAHNAVAIAVVAVIGGFLSPVLLSTGENHPYALFLYIAVLDLVAMGAAYYRRWRLLEGLCFLGTCLMYSGWYAKFYHTDQAGQMMPALIFATLFYLMFLLIPTLHGLIRRVRESPEGVTLVALNAFFWLMNYYRILYPEHSQMLGFVCIGQAVLMFVLFRAWTVRVGSDTRTAELLLIATLALVMAAVPLHLKLYGIPIAWGLEGALLAYAGVRFNQAITRFAAVAALVLAAGGLLHRLPLHTAVFVPVLNIPFGSWALVSAAAIVASWLLNRRPKVETDNWINGFLAPAAFVLGFALACGALSLEVAGYWQRVYTGPDRHTHAVDSLVLLWSIIPAAVATVLHRKRLLDTPFEVLMWACFVMGCFFFFVALFMDTGNAQLLFVNSRFPLRFPFLLALWWAASRYAADSRLTNSSVLEIAGYVLLAFLLASEIGQWSADSDIVNRRAGLALVSAVWAAEAMALIWFGLTSRRKMRRLVGFVLFGVTIGKVLLVDTQQLEQVYRIISFIGSGILIVGAAYFYHRYSAMLQKEEGNGEGQ